MTKNSNKACFLCFDYMIFQETRDKRQETRDKRQETRDKRQDNPLIFSDTVKIFQEFSKGHFYYFLMEG